jgi:hypothetical protein
LNEADQYVAQIIQLNNSGNQSIAITQLISLLKKNMGQRYYFDWQNFKQRFKYYSDSFPDAMEKHARLSDYHQSTYGSETSWQLPFKNLKNEDVTAYELRHLARQQKSRDMTMMYFEGSEPNNLEYFVAQVADLNRAFENDAYDDEGNGVYEVYRAGRRIHNWLFNHNAYLASEEYDQDKQLLLIRTFLHHGAQLYKRTAKNRYGNHHTKGLVALFEISALFPEFTDTKKWLKQAIAGLTWHIEREINADGFQFERSVHYHKGDIENYFRVYQLARINNIELPDIYVTQFRKMFHAMVDLAQPNRKLPVLQDDTDKPFAENNNMDDAMTIGTIMFRDSVFRYFSTNKIPGSIYWLIRSDQLDLLKNISKQKPQTGSTQLSHTGYYTMRDGWQKADMYMTVSAGLSEYKPDHQHGDMLGIVAYANGTEILPNYQVRYKYPDYIFWKNSWVKNVALVDSIPQGRQWKQNRGKSGFGKWLYLPEPRTISWIKEDSYDHYIGSHSGFDSINVDYYREVIFLHNNFWIVCDHFESDNEHTYQQVWQGDYKTISNSLIKKVISKNSLLTIEQLQSEKYKIETGSFREKNNSVFSVAKKGKFSFITLLKPQKNIDSENQSAGENCLTGNKWLIVKEAPNFNTDASVILTHFNQIILINGTFFNHPKLSFKVDNRASVAVNIGRETVQVRYLGRKNTIISKNPDSAKGPDFKTVNIDPGEIIEIPL